MILTLRFFKPVGMFVICSTMLLSLVPAGAGGRNLRVKSPAFGDVWFYQRPYTIEWNSDSFAGTVVIDLYKGRRYIRTITSNCSSKGWHLWTVPGHLTSGGDYQVMITDGSKDGNGCVSEYFRIVGNIQHLDAGMHRSVEYAGAWAIHTVDVGNVGYYSSIGLDDANRPHISHYDANQGNLEHAYWDGSQWQTETVDSYRNVGTWTSIAVDDMNNVHISYCHEDDRDLKYAKWDGLSWQTQIADASGNRGQWTSITLDGLGNPHASYIYGGAGDLMYAFKTGPVWGTVCVDDYRDVGKWTSIALDGQGYPHISYHDYYWLNYTLKYAYWDGSQWSKQTIASYPSGYYTSIAVDNGDCPHISHQGPGHCGYIYWTGSSWHSETIEPHTGDLYIGGRRYLNSPR